MRKTLLVVAVLLFAYTLYVRQRLFVRDPLAAVSHNSARDSGTQVYINFSSDVLLEDDSPMYVLLLQHDDHVGLPASLHCIHYVLCLTDQDKATLTGGGFNITVDNMTAREVRYHGRDSATTVTLY